VQVAVYDCAAEYEWLTDWPVPTVPSPKFQLYDV